MGAKPSMNFAGSALEKYRHVCVFVHSTEAGYRLLLPFILEGLERGEKVFHVVDPMLRDEHRKRLEFAGIDTAAAEQSGQLELRDWRETYLSGGRFDQDKMLAIVEDVFVRSQEQQFPLTRLVGHAEWAAEDQESAQNFLEYEAKLNIILAQYKDAVICVYDLAKFNAEMIMDVMRTHPLVIIGGVLAENPFFVPPDEFLVELRERGTRRQARGLSARAG